MQQQRCLRFGRGRPVWQMHELLVRRRQRVLERRCLPVLSIWLFRWVLSLRMPRRARYALLRARRVRRRQNRHGQLQMHPWLRRTDLWKNLRRRCPHSLQSPRRLRSEHCRMPLFRRQCERALDGRELHAMQPSVLRIDVHRAVPPRTRQFTMLRARCLLRRCLLVLRLRHLRRGLRTACQRNLLHRVPSGDIRPNVPSLPRRRHRRVLRQWNVSRGAARHRALLLRRWLFR